MAVRPPRPEVCQPERPALTAELASRGSHAPPGEQEACLGLEQGERQRIEADLRPARADLFGREVFDGDIEGSEGAIGVRLEAVPATSEPEDTRLDEDLLGHLLAQGDPVLSSPPRPARIERICSV